MTRWFQRVLTVLLAAAATACSSTCGSGARTTPNNGVQAGDQTPGIQLLAGPLVAPGLEEAIGQTPEAIYAWVRSDTRFVPYVGLLRGADGVLTDMRGNSLDRSLLLAESLRKRGAEVRLARGTLTPEQASAVLASAISEAARPTNDGIAASAATEAQLSAEAEERAAAAGKAHKQLFAELQRTVGESHQSVSANLSALKSRRRDTRPDDLKAIQDHWWVQVKNGDTWQDFDLSMPDGRPGKTLGSLAETHELDSLANELKHELRITVIVEQNRGGEISEAVALEHAVQPALLGGKTIQLSFAPRDWPKGAHSESEATARLASDAAAVTSWIPLLTYGTTVVSQQAFTREGDVVSPSEKSNTGADRVVGGLGSALGGGDDDAPGQLGAIWVEFELRAPNQEPRKVRREFLDLLGAGLRHKGQLTLPSSSTATKERIGLSLIGGIEILPLVADLTSRSVARLVDQALEQCDKGFKAIGTATSITFDAAGKLLEACGEFPGPLHRVASLRRGSATSRTYLKSINVLSLISRPLRGSTPRVVTEQIVDLAVSDVGVLAADSSSAFDESVQQGILDGAAESLAFDDTTGRESTAGVFRDAVKLGLQGRVFGQNDLETIESLPLADDAKARMIAAVKEGYILLAPSRPAGSSSTPYGWWRVDPATGSTVGVMESGFHQNTTNVGLANTLVSQTMISGPKFAAAMARSGVIGMLGVVMRFVVEKILPCIQGRLNPGSPLHRYLISKQVEIHLWLEKVGQSPLKVFQR